MAARNKTLPKLTKLLKIIFIFLMICLAYSFIEPYLIEEKTTVFHDSDIPQNFVGKRIVFIADIHHGEFFSQERVANVVKEVNNLDPDIIVLGGDYVWGDKKYIEPVFEELSKLKARLGIYGVTGNHDDYESYDLTVKNMKKAGITVLSDKAEWLKIGDERIKIAGIDWYFIKEPDISPLIKDASVKDFVLFVSHTPDFAENLKTDKLDLMLSGHTHGGQVTFFGLWAPYIPSDYGQKYRTGLVKTDRTTVLISNGIGSTVLPMRFFAPPQINIIELEK